MNHDIATQYINTRSLFNRNPDAFLAQCHHTPSRHPAKKEMFCAVSHGYIDIADTWKAQDTIRHFPAVKTFLFTLAKNIATAVHKKIRCCI